RFRRMDEEAVSFPIHVSPTERKQLGGATYPTKATQRQDQTPFGIRASVHYPARRLLGDEVLAALVHLRRGLYVLKGIADDEPASDGGTEELLGPLGRPSGRAVGVALRKPEKPSVGIAWRDAVERPSPAEVFDKASLARFEVDSGSGLDVSTAVDVRGEEIAQHCASPLGNQSHGRELRRQIVADARHP